MKKRILIIAGLVALLVTGTAYAIVRRERNRPFADRIVNHLSRQLDLTDAQKTQVKTILEAERSKVAPLLAEAGKNRQQLHESTASGKFDEAQVRAIAAEQAKTMTELMVEKERVKAKIYNEVLTPEQRTKADAMLQRMQSHFRERMHGRLDGNAPERP
jgi:Spy/CpxP family protein refolding chaperone